jgi:hypothetical protein
MDYKQAAAFRAFNIKIESLLTAFRSHLQDIEKQPIMAMLQGA